MLSYSDIFNIKNTTLPLTKKELKKILSTQVFVGYVMCPYKLIIDTLTDIAKADSYEVTLNTDKMYQDGNNPLSRGEVIIKVEGMRDYSEFMEGVITSNDDLEWSSFMTYSSMMRDEIQNAKCLVIKKYLWNAQNIQQWFEDANMPLPEAVFQEYTSNFEKFKEDVLSSPDLNSFISSCDENELLKAHNLLIKKLSSILIKHKTELNMHVSRRTKNEETIVLKNPVINRIFILSQYANACKNDWPIIKFTSLDKRSFDSISLWED